jgi:hypothetical protein
MRYFVAVLSVLVGLVASPTSTNAQAEEESASSEPTAQEPVSEPVSEEPALQLKLDEAGVEVVEMQRRVRNAGIGMGISGASVLVGGVLTAAAFSEGVLPDDPEAAGQPGIEIAGATLLVGGVVSLLATGILLGLRKRELRSREQELRELQRDLPLGAIGARPQAHRVQWDLARSRLVF